LRVHGYDGWDVARFEDPHGSRDAWFRWIRPPPGKAAGPEFGAPVGGHCSQGLPVELTAACGSTVVTPSLRRTSAIFLAFLAYRPFGLRRR
jgi:hypothetical protein